MKKLSVLFMFCNFVQMSASGVFVPQVTKQQAKEPDDVIVVFDKQELTPLKEKLNALKKNNKFNYLEELIEFKNLWQSIFHQNLIDELTQCSVLQSFEKFNFLEQKLYILYQYASFLFKNRQNVRMINFVDTFSEEFEKQFILSLIVHTANNLYMLHKHNVNKEHNQNGVLSKNLIKSRNLLCKNMTHKIRHLACVFLNNGTTVSLSIHDLFQRSLGRYIVLLADDRNNGVYITDKQFFHIDNMPKFLKNQRCKFERTVSQYNNKTNQQ